MRNERYYGALIYIYIHTNIYIIQVKARSTENEMRGFIGSDNEDVTGDDIDLTNVENSTSAQLNSSTLSFVPIYMISQWKEPTTKDDRISLAILLPSGTSDKIDDISVRIINGIKLELTIPWPSAFLNINCEGFSTYRMQFQTQETDVIQSTAEILLPFEVVADFEQHLLGWNGNNQEVLFVILKAPSKMYTKDIGKLRMKRASGTYGAGTTVSNCTELDRGSEPFCRLK